mmetsp:Transcript_8931/g.22540  ORF Transcript_8931/g.22540 Transcript_8931/m.22540 type:complete len:697 (+) Transcript_8931:37-2127(+)
MTTKATAKMMTAEEEQEHQRGGEDNNMMMMQLQEVQDDHAAKVHQMYDWSALPRSIRWRLQLGILSEPPPAVTPQQLDLESVLKHNQPTVKEINDKFKELVTNHVEVEEENDDDDDENGGDNNSTNETSAAASTGGGAAIIDPLTAMVMEEEARETRKAELYLKYRKERARRKRGLTTEARIIESECDEVVDRASLVIIEKDLKRLPHPAEGKQPGQTEAATTAGAVSIDVHEHDARITSLREVLYIFAQEHKTMGYRQGMHEVASYLMYVLELEHEQYPDHPLFNPILPICYSLLERVLNQLQTAYDASGGKSLQQMSVTILGKILQNDNTLYHHLTSNPNIPPPPIYCTRWVRLMFSREVVGYENVFRLWDVLFEFKNVMYAIEICCATRILLMRDALMVDTHITLDLLMNVPPLTDITQLATTLERLMMQKDTDPPVPIPRSRQVIPRPTNAVQGGFAAATMPSQQQQQTAYTASYPGLQNLNAQAPVGDVSTMTVQNIYQPSSAVTTTSFSLGDSTKFSFSKMRQSLGQTSDSLRKKLVTTTNEWKQAAAERQASNNASLDPLSAIFAGEASPTNYHQFPPNSSSAGVGVGGASSQFADPLLNQPSSSGWPSGPASNTPTAMAMPKTPKQHLHEGWSTRLEDKVMTIQTFLQDLKSKEVEDSIPSEVWEALAELDQMKRELRNYSRSMNGSM